MKVITKYPIIIDEVNVSANNDYSNVFGDDKKNIFGQSSTGNAFGTTNTSLGNFRVVMPISNIPTNTTITSNSYKPKESKKYFNIEKTQAEKDFLTQQKLFKTKKQEPIKNKKLINWWNKKNNLQKGLIIGSSLIFLGIGTFLIYKSTIKK